jgi:hypothetical protein
MREANITNDPNVDNAEESIAFSLLIQHSENATKEEIQLAALGRARDILAPRRYGPFGRRSKTPAGGCGTLDQAIRSAEGSAIGIGRDKLWSTILIEKSQRGKPETKINGSNRS